MLCLLASLLLQNCEGSYNLVIEREEEPLTTTIEQEEGQDQGRRKRARVEMEQGEEPRLMEQEQDLIEEQEGNALPTIMPDLWQEIFSYLDFGWGVSGKSS
jgi:hypothetical protein